MTRAARLNNPNSMPLITTITIILIVKPITSQKSYTNTHKITQYYNAKRPNSHTNTHNIVLRRRFGGCCDNGEGAFYFCGYLRTSPRARPGGDPPPGGRGPGVQAVQGRGRGRQNANDPRTGGRADGRTRPGRQTAGIVRTGSRGIYSRGTC